VKTAVILLLTLIAAGVGYLAYTNYQEREMATQLAEAIADPDAYLVRSWSKRAKLECDVGVSDVVTRQARAGAIPVSFTCRASTGIWKIAERGCTHAESDLVSGSAQFATGLPRKVGDVYRPLHVLCWDVVEKQ
jgi:hypothetical protein